MYIKIIITSDISIIIYNTQDLSVTSFELNDSTIFLQCNLAHMTSPQSTT